MRFFFKFAGACIAIVLLGALAILLFDRIWYQIGFGAAILVVFGGLLFFAWNTDRKDKAKRGDLPPV
jgi:hypothetical protein